jgi:hypothetical protein
VTVDLLVLRDRHHATMQCPQGAARQVQLAVRARMRPVDPLEPDPPRIDVDLGYRRNRSAHSREHVVVGDTSS